MTVLTMILALCVLGAAVTVLIPVAVILFVVAILKRIFATGNSTQQQI